MREMMQTANIASSRTGDGRGSEFDLKLLLLLGFLPSYFLLRTYWDKIPPPI